MSARRARRRRERSRQGSEALRRASAPAAEPLLRAIELHRSGRLEEAEEVYRSVLSDAPDHPDALHFLGVLAHQRGRSREAEELIRRALLLCPTHADALNNLGNVLKDLGRYAEAEAAYRRAIELAPGHANAHSNLGTVCHALGRLDDAIAAYRRAIALDPGHAEAHLHLGNALQTQGRLGEAMDAYLATLSLGRFRGAAYRSLGSALYAAGRVGDAVRVYEKWLGEEPDHPVARHMLAACSGVAVPARASDDFVRDSFDRMAASFDTQLASLGYRAPELLLGAIRAALPPPAGDLDVLDAGSGTGLCGLLLRPYARTLTGVDLSGKMIERARARHVYDELVQAELTGYLARQRARYDLIVSADTLVYFGDLRFVFEAAAGALAPEGRMVFTLERADGEEGDSRFRLEAHGRYSHGERYVRETLTTAGLECESLAHATLRMEAGSPVAGLVVVARVP